MDTTHEKIHEFKTEIAKIRQKRWLMFIASVGFGLAFPFYPTKNQSFLYVEWNMDYGWAAFLHFALIYALMMVFSIWKIRQLQKNIRLLEQEG